MAAHYSFEFAKVGNNLILVKLGFLGKKWLNLLTKWYIVVKCGRIFYIFALNQF